MTEYRIMHGEQHIASVTAQGRAEIRHAALLPYDLYLEEADDFDTLVNNLNNFHYWCATRLLVLERVYAKELLNSIGASQAGTDKDRAQVALSYHCLTLTDIYWVQRAEESLSFADISLFSRTYDNVFVDLALKGSQTSVPDAHVIARDVSTGGLCPKAWVRKDDAFYLLKDGDEADVENELLASKICSCFDVPAVRYEEETYEGLKVSASRLITDPEHGIASRGSFEIHAKNHDIDTEQFILSLDAHGFYMMNIIDYLVGNTDRHWGNWGFLIDNRTNTPLRLHDLMDFNRSFRSYDTTDGANCQTVLPRHLTQKEAALEAVQKNGLHRLRDVPQDWFQRCEPFYDMFMKRLAILQQAV